MRCAQLTPGSSFNQVCACRLFPALCSYAATADWDASPYLQGYVSARIHHMLLTGELCSDSKHDKHRNSALTVTVKLTE
jgi:hypothetical protein